MKILKIKNKFDLKKILLIGIIILFFTQKNFSQNNVFAIIIGINKYDKYDDLKYAENDAEFYKSLFNIDDKRIEIFLGSEKTLKLNNQSNLIIFGGAYSNRIGNIFSSIKKNSKKGDKFYFIFSGHGNTEGNTEGNTDENKATLLFQNAPKKNYVGNNGTLLIDDILKFCNILAKKHVESYLIIDACHSGYGYGNDPYGFTATANKIKSLGNSEFIHLISASESEAFELKSKDYGALTYGIKQFLKPGIDISQVKTKIIASVEKITKEEFNIKQTPIIKGSGIFFKHKTVPTAKPDDNKPTGLIDYFKSFFVYLNDGKLKGDKSAYSKYIETEEKIIKNYNKNTFAINMLDNMKAALIDKLDEQVSRTTLNYGSFPMDTIRLNVALEYSETVLKLIDKDNFFINHYKARKHTIASAIEIERGNLEKAEYFANNAISLTKYAVDSYKMLYHISKKNGNQYTFFRAQEYLSYRPNDAIMEAKFNENYSLTASKKGGSCDNCLPKNFKTYSLTDSINFEFETDNNVPPFDFTITDANNEIISEKEINSYSIVIPAFDIKPKSKSNYFIWKVKDKDGDFRYTGYFIIR